MNTVRTRRDSRLIDAIEAIDPVEYEGTVWRATREGRDPILCSSSGGRWDDGSFDVLYTSQEAQGAISEIRYHLSQGQPIFPTLVKYKLYELEVRLDRALQLLDLPALQSLGLNTATYGRLSYERASEEYPRTQEIGEVAHFLDFDGLIVPSARHDCPNLVLFCDRVNMLVELKEDHGLIDWNK